MPVIACPCLPVRTCLSTLLSPVPLAVAAASWEVESLSARRRPRATDRRSSLRVVPQAVAASSWEVESLSALWSALLRAAARGHHKVAVLLIEA